MIRRYNIFVTMAKKQYRVIDLFCGCGGLSLGFEQAGFNILLGIDMWKVAMFGITAKEWRDANPDKKGNIRDYATINELICLSNMENLNAVFINDGMPQTERLIKLNQVAIQQMKVLEESENRKYLK